MDGFEVNNAVFDPDDVDADRDDDAAARGDDDTPLDDFTHADDDTPFDGIDQPDDYTPLDDIPLDGMINPTMPPRVVSLKPDSATLPASGKPQMPQG